MRGGARAGRPARARAAAGRSVQRAREKRRAFTVPRAGRGRDGQRRGRLVHVVYDDDGNVRRRVRDDAVRVQPHPPVPVRVRGAALASGAGGRAGGSAARAQGRAALLRDARDARRADRAGRGAVQLPGRQQVRAGDDDAQRRRPADRRRRGLRRPPGDARARDRLGAPAQRGAGVRGAQRRAVRAHRHERADHRLGHAVPGARVRGRAEDRVRADARVSRGLGPARAPADRLHRGREAGRVVTRRAAARAWGPSRPRRPR